ncbi:hypothetical protein VNO77_22104 [Canavalia gladiata]|uniref:Uncharacterized protein n=1 Tax=Canavalia gladiata TaxID=3824 RepID=A0AAN9Q7Q7_CANGL
MNPSPTTTISHCLKVEGMQEVQPALNEFDSFHKSSKGCFKDCNSFDSVSIPQKEFTPSEEVDVAAKFSSLLVSVTKTSSILLIQQLAKGSQIAKSITASEIRLLAKTGKENCVAFIF